MKIISLVYGYSARNAGDFAITLGAIDILLELGYKVKLFSRYRAKSTDYKDAYVRIKGMYGDRVEIYECPFSLDRSASKFTMLKNYADGMLSIIGVNKQRAFKKALLDSDFVIFNGGNLFRCRSFIDFSRLTALLYPLELAKKRKKKYIIFPQSASTINGLGKKLLIPILKGAQKVMIRENESYQYLSSLMGDRNFSKSIDLAFFINKNHLPLSGVNGTGKVALTLRFHNIGDIAYLPQKDIDTIFERHETIINKLKKIGKKPIVVIQTQKDEKLSLEFAQKHNLEVYNTNNVSELLSFYAQVDMLIGMRLHSIILALSVGTPCMGIFYRQWGLKNPGLMQHFDLPYYYYDEPVTKTDLSNAIIKNLLCHDMIKDKIMGIIEREEINIKKTILEIIQ